MSLTPIPPERCGHVAPIVIEPMEGRYAAHCLRWGASGRSWHGREKRDGRCWSWDGGTAGANPAGTSSRAWSADMS